MFAVGVTVFVFAKRDIDARRIEAVKEERASRVPKQPVIMKNF